MTVRDAFVVDEIPSERWEMALDLIGSGGPLVLVEREISLGFQRHIGWPTADGRVHVSAYTAASPSQLTEAAVEQDGRMAAQLLADVVERDAQLSRLLNALGFDFDYVYDYGNGAVKIGSISSDGHIALM